MEEIVVMKKNGEVRHELMSTSPFIAVTDAKRQAQFMGNDYVQLAITSEVVLSFEIGDYIELNGRTYSIRTISDVTRKGDDLFEYSVLFYGVMYDLLKSQFRNTSVDGRSHSATFDLTLSLSGFLDVIVNNMRRCGYNGWSYDAKSCPATEPRTLSFDRANCLTALQNVTTEFEQEFAIVQLGTSFTIKVGEIGVVRNQSMPLEYGRGMGLYELTEQKVDDTTIVNRLWAEGGTENILSGYRGYSDRLQLPRKRLNKYAHTLSDGTSVVANSQMIGIVEDSTTGDANRYIDEEVLHGLQPTVYPSGELIDKYGVLEGTEYFDDIYPTREYSVKSLNNGDARLSFGTNIDFDLVAKWTMPVPTISSTASNFIEWCAVRYTKTPTFANYKGCYTFYHDSALQTAWERYKAYCNENGNVGWVYWNTNVIVSPNVTPDGWSEEFYTVFIAYADAVESNANKYMLDSAKIAFTSGKLAGIEFGISSFSNSGKKISIVAFEDETGTLFPSEEEFGAFRVEVGDKFKLIGIYMPYTYYEEAEERLWYAALEQFEDLKSPKVKYNLQLDPLFVEENEALFTTIEAGDYIVISDVRFGITNQRLRVTQVDVNVRDGMDYSYTLETVRKKRKRLVSASVLVSELNSVVSMSGLKKATNTQARNVTTKTLSGTVNEQGVNIVRLKDETTELSSSVTTLNNQVASHTQQIAKKVDITTFNNLNDTVQEHDTNIVALQKYNETINNSIGSINATTESLIKAVDTNSTGIASLQKDNKDIRTNIADVKDVAANADNNASSALSKATSAERAAKVANAKVAEITESEVSGIPAIMSAIANIHATLNGKSFSECNQQICRAITLNDLPWSKVVEISGIDTSIASELEKN